MAPQDPPLAPEADALIELTGADRLEWLQGQATNDVRPLAEGRAVSFCLCAPTGQILAIVDARSDGGRILMRTAEATASAVLERVERMTILEDVEARRIDGAGPPFPMSEEDRIAAGVPRWGVDVGPRTLPAEMGPDFEARHVSYAKGCYTGQEVLMRMHARGHANRTWVGLVADAPMRVGEPVEYEGRVVGTVASAAGALAAATLRSEATEEGTSVRVGGRVAQVRTMPIRRSS